MPTFWTRCALALDILVQMVFARLLDWIFQTKEFGSTGMTISARLGKLKYSGNPRACKVCGWLNKLFREPDHCVLALENWNKGK
jgi:hypothetical protein